MRDRADVIELRAEQISRVKAELDRLRERVRLRVIDGPDVDCLIARLEDRLEALYRGGQQQ